MKAFITVASVMVLLVPGLFANVTFVAALPAGAIVPDAEVDSAGVIHVAYLLANDVFYVSSGDEGKTFSESVRINSEAGFASGAGFRGPDIAVGKDGGIHVIWYNAGYQQKRPKDEWGVMYSRLDKSKQRFEKERNLNQRPSDNFSIAADPTGKVAVIWMAGGVFASLSADGGETFLPAEKLELDPCECCGSRAIYSGDGSLSVLYRDKTDNLRDTNIARLSAVGGKWSNQVISKTPWPIDSCPMTGGFISRAAKGLVVAWETKNQVYFSMLSQSALRIVNKREIRAADKGKYPVVLGSGDSTLVAWKNDRMLEWQLFDSDGKPVGDPDRFSSTSPHRPAGVVAKSGQFILFP
jgi:hypothetical protein